MMRFFVCISLLLLGLMMVQAANAAELLTLDDCIELALKNRASVIAAKGREQLAGANKKAALGAFLPRVDMSYTHRETRNRNVKSDSVGQIPYVSYFLDSVLVQDTISNNSFYVYGANPHVDSLTTTIFKDRPLDDQDRSNKSLEFSANMSIFDLSNWFDYAGAKVNQSKARLDVIGSEQDLIHAVKVSYYLFLAAVKNVEVQDQAVERSTEQLKLIQSKYDLGSASKSDVLKQKVQMGNDRLAQLSAQNDVNSGRASLAYTVGLDPNSDVGFSTEYTMREYSGTLEEALNYGLEHNPGLLSSELNVDINKQTVRSRKAKYLPTLVGFGSLSYSDGTQGDTATFNFSSRSTTFGFQIKLNIFDGFAREYNLTRAKVNYNTARAQYADRRNFTSQSIKAKYLDIERLIEKQNVSQENVDAADEDLKITQEKYNLGAATILDLLDAQVSLKRAQVSLIEADFELNLAISNLENAMGKM
jgi:outer membrane protein